MNVHVLVACHRRFTTYNQQQNNSHTAVSAPAGAASTGYTIREVLLAGLCQQDTPLLATHSCLACVTSAHTASAAPNVPASLQYDRPTVQLVLMLVFLLAAQV
jgi:hypothetical protein